MSNSTFDTYLKTEEFITAEEYLRRRERGEINPKDVRVVLADMEKGTFGGFCIKLKTPEYRVMVPKETGKLYGW